MDTSKNNFSLLLFHGHNYEQGLVAIDIHVNALFCNLIAAGAGISVDYGKFTIGLSVLLS